MKLFASITAAVISLALIAVALTSCGTIETGHVGVRTTLGKVSSEVVEPGLFLGLPGISAVREFSAKEIALDINDLTPKARDNLSLRDLDVTLYYRVEAGAITRLYTKYADQHGRDEAGRRYFPAYQLVTRLARNTVYEETSRFDSLTMHTKREELANAIQRSLQQELERNDKGVIQVTRVVIRQLTTDPAIEKSIQEAVAAQKQLETTRQRVAIAEAEALVEIKKAEGIAKANAVINQSLTREYLQHEANLALMEFAKKGGNSTVVIPANMQTAPLIQVK